jgi:hypothetical protein
VLLANERLVVTAQLRAGAVRAPGVPRVNEIGSDELGLQGNGASLFALLGWAQLLLLASCALVWAWRRWARWPAWVIAVPVLALLLLLCFDSFTSLLPSTL